MRIKSKVVAVPANSTAQTIESALDTHLNSGWVFVGIFQVGANFFAILTRTIAK